MRPLIYVSVGLLLALLALAGLGEAAAFRDAAAEREQRLARERLQSLVDQWETGVVDRVALWATDLDGPRSTERAGTVRGQIPWFDGWYRWESTGGVVVPAPAVQEDLTALRREPCLAEAAAAAGGSDYAGAARRYEACARETTLDPSARLLAASEAAEHYLNADAPGAARDAIATVGSLTNRGLSAAAGVDVRRVAALRLQEARALDRQGRSDLAERLLTALAQEVTALEAPELDRVLPLYLYPIAHDLKAYGGPTLGGDDDEPYARAQRRLAVWEELRDRPTPAQPIAGARLLVDPYGDPPWLLSYEAMPGGGFVGVALDQPGLVATFIERAPATLRPHLSVRDPTGKWLAGSQAPLETEVAFTRVLPHLRAGLTPGAVSLGASTARTLVVQLLPVATGLLMGVLALLALVSNDRRQQRLMAQQREFMTRVTHELKTPLAGIRLMAENLELGTFRDGEQRVRFARQIVKEAERLGDRLDEVIRAAARPLEEAAVETDLSEMLRALAETWRPRFEQQRGALAVELPEGPVLARVRPVQVRDAVTNLLDNALKYRSPDRALRCTLRLVADRRWVNVELSDNGLGVPPERRRQIFERFARVEGPGRGFAGGHGLGLAFVADAARAHGGKVDCRDGPEGGSTFTLRIRRT